ncbi:MAG: metal ABC transporter permease [Anaerolineales bacterium]|jgi:ABC-type Mn2+/Zn2+ transport system permease subunit|nr:metal ABC transporter permease [Anaerolineales bacterium]
MIAWLLTPFSLVFMQRGLLAALIVGVLCAIVGSYVVLRSMAFLGDALAHAILPGVAIAYLMGENLIIGALIAAVLVALGINALSQRGAIKEDTAIGILFAASLALGVVIISRIRTYATDLNHILFGNLLGVNAADLWLTGILALLVLLSIALLYRPFLIVSFDPILATTLHLPIKLLNNLMLIMIALTIVISIQTVGVGLVAAMLVTPAATAYLLARRLPTMMALSAIFGAISSLTGLYLSYYADIPSGAAIVLVATFIFLLAFFFSPRQGFLTRLRGAQRTL